VGFRELLNDQISAAHDAAEANDLLGQADLGEWWRWRVDDLERFLADADPAT
jgi:hypothetical protein